MVVWIVGFRTIVVRVSADHEWLGTLCVALGVAHAILTLAAGALQRGSVLGKAESIDPTVVGHGTEGTLIIYGPLSRLLEAAFLFAAAAAIQATDVLPIWLTWSAYAAGAVQVAFIPTLFSGTSPAHFYSINGWNAPIAAGLFLSWILGASIVLL